MADLAANNAVDTKRSCQARWTASTTDLAIHDRLHADMAHLFFNQANRERDSSDLLTIPSEYIQLNREIGPGEGGKAATYFMIGVRAT